MNADAPGGLRFMHGVVAAAVLALALAALFTVLAPGLGTRDSLKLLSAAACGLYLGVIACTRGLRRGRLVVPVLWLLSAGLISAANLGPGMHLLAHTVVLSLVRAMICHRSLLSAVLDLALGGLALVAAVATATHTASIALSVWCYFLVQSLFVLIPPQWRPRGDATPTAARARFATAHAQAENALKRLSPLS